MQLPVTGHPLHTRSLTLVVSLQAGGMWHARGDVIDLRKCGFVPMQSDIQPAGIIHQMSIDLALDPATRVIDSVEVAQPAVAIEPSPATQGECCRDPAPKLLALAGERIDGAFAKQLSSVFGGPRGCSHLLTLFQLMASGLDRAFALEAGQGTRLAEQRRVGERLFRRSVFVDGYEAADAAIQLTVQLGDFHSRPEAVVKQPLERLAREDAVRAFARVSSPGMVMSDLALGERSRSWEDLGSAAWRDRSDRVRGLSEVPIIPGLARRLFGLFGSEPQDRLLLDTLLQLAPGHIQVLAAVMDRWYADSPGGAGRGSAERPTRGTPDIGNIGGMPDSCYMWRSEGALAKRGFGSRGE